MNKFDNFYYSKLRNEKARLESFSGTSEFKGCPYTYKLKKNKLKSMDNIFTKAGTLTHDMTEGLYDSDVELDRKQLENKFEEELFLFICNGYNFPTVKTKSNYISNMKLYFRHIIKDKRIIKCEEFCAFPLITINRKYRNMYFQGWIDAVLEDEDGNVYIGDFKSSTKYSEEEIKKDKGHQLILYAIAYEFLYKKPVKGIFFDFMKYVTVLDKDGKKSVIERRNATEEELKNGIHGYVFVDLDEEIKNNTIKWLCDTIDFKNKCIEDDYFPRGEENNGKSFFCKNLCGFYGYGMCK